jgi:HAD superfamily hydrolase (TIGR01490 family)
MRGNTPGGVTRSYTGAFYACTSMKLVLFDLDNTLLAGDSDYAWAQFLIRRGILDGAAHEARNQAFYAQYKAGTLNIHEFLEFQLRVLGEYPRAQLDAWHRDYMIEDVRPMITDAARQRVRQEQADADLIAIITATNRFVTAPIAAEFGIADLIATEVEEIDGRYTGRGTGIPCFREDKITRLEMWLTARGLRWQDIEHSRFYSDSLNDLPLLQKVHDPIAVDPDPTLRAHALAQGWPVISLRDA